MWMKGILGESIFDLDRSADTLVGATRASRPGSREAGRADHYRKLYFARLDCVKASYSGSPAVDDNGDYVRIDGPRVWIEFCCQGDDHYHTIWRDRVTDHGAEFSF